MKKYIVILLAGLFLTTGCESGNKVVCTGKNEQEGQSMEAKITGHLKDNKIDKVDYEMSFSHDESAQLMCGMIAFANSSAENKIDYKCDGKKITIKGLTSSIDSDSSYVGLTKEEFINTIQSEAENVTCK